MRTVLVVAPHPDDETLGCGGGLLNHGVLSDHIYWLIATQMTSEAGFSDKQIRSREREIEEVAVRYGFKDVVQLKFPTTRLDVTPMFAIIEKTAAALMKIKPEWIYLPYPNDVHTDHKAMSSAVASCMKWFRAPFIERIMAYETLSETGFNLDPVTGGFRPNVYQNITGYLDEKIEIMKLYQDEIGPFPFPRSEEAIRSLAILRGTEAGFKAAEAFMLLKERIS